MKGRTTGVERLEAKGCFQILDNDRLGRGANLQGEWHLLDRGMRKKPRWQIFDPWRLDPRRVAANLRRTPEM
jgi:hypothetical protein